jgi:LPS-assembly protein
LLPAGGAWAQIQGQNLSGQSWTAGQPQKLGWVPVAASGAAAPAGTVSPPHADNSANANQPVGFEADRVSYDNSHTLVIAEGHVEAWQNGNILRADKITFNKTTSTAAAYGHVVLIQPDGETMFAEYAELNTGLKDGVLRGMSAQLANNVKLAANGARRSDGGLLTDMARPVYSPCNCAAIPGSVPLWQLRAETATRDLQNKLVEYQNVWLDFDGQPIVWFPYFSHIDPSVRRASGLLIPTYALSDSHLGSYVTLPYYYVIDNASDVTVTPLIASGSGPQVEAEYRRAMNEGAFSATTAVASDEHRAQGFIASTGNFSWDDTWRYGFYLNAASSVDYLRDYHVLPIWANVLPSAAYIEGFGVGSYSRLDVRGYQALDTAVVQNQLPYVLPRYDYSYFGPPDVLGGSVRFDMQTFNIVRDYGGNDQRLAARLGWDRVATGAWGDRWQFTWEGEGQSYRADRFNELPNYGDVTHAAGAAGFGQAAVKLNWPFSRMTDGGSVQTIEPIVQVIFAPQDGNSQNRHLLNEDSLDYEFTDASLFSLNRFGGFDRHDGGERVNFGLHGSWLFPNMSLLDALIGASYREHIDYNLYPQFQPWNGFAQNSHLSDIVARTGFAPNQWADFVMRGRFDHDRGTVRFADAVASVGPSNLRFSVGYLYSSTDPFALYTSDYTITGNSGEFAQGSTFYQHRNEVSAGLTVRDGAYAASGGVQRDLATGDLVGYQMDAKYENECFIFDISANRRYTSIDYDKGNTTILFTVTFKTLGQLGVKG